MWNRARRLVNVNTDAFTLVEVLIAMAMVGIVMAGIYTVFISTNRAYHTQDRVVDAQQRARVGVDFMVRDIRMAGFDPQGSAGAGIEVAQATRIRLTADMDRDGTIDEDNRERITYEFDSTSNELRQWLYETTGSVTWQTLIKDVSALSFTYLDADGNTTATLADIRTVVISMDVEGEDVRGEPFTRTLNTRVNCRNLYL